MRPEEILTLLWILVCSHITITWFLAIRRGWRARKNEVSKEIQFPKDLPPVSIIIPAWNERGTIEPCIQSLKEITYPVWEVVILAGGTDGTYQATLKTAEGDEHFRVMERGPEPKNVAILKGIQAAKNDILVLLDADSIISRDWLKEMVKPLMNDASVSVGHRMPKKNTWISLAEQMEDIHAFAIQNTPPIYGDSSVAVWREHIEGIGSLPPDAYAREDWAIEVKLIEEGGSIHFAKEAKLSTNRPATFKEAWINSVRNHQARLGGIKDHFKRFRSEPLWAFGMAYYFILFFGIVFALLISSIFGYLLPGHCLHPGNISMLILIWIILRSIAMAVEVSIFTGDLIWLARSPFWIGLFIIRIVTAGPAFLAGSLQNPFYQGPRISA